MPCELFVTLKSSRNAHLTYPCQDWLELFELGTDGSVIVGVWRGLSPEGRKQAPVEVKQPVFEYNGGRGATTCVSRGLTK